MRDILLTKKSEIESEVEMYKKALEHAKGKLDLLNELIDELDAVDENDETSDEEADVTIEADYVD